MAENELKVKTREGSKEKEAREADGKVLVLKKVTVVVAMNYSYCFDEELGDVEVVLKVKARKMYVQSFAM